VDILFVILAHTDRSSLEELVDNVRTFAPRARLLLYNSGDDAGLCGDLGVPEVPSPRAFDYARITPFFLDVFEWLKRSGDPLTVVNVETDMPFIRRYEAFVSAA
jgi:hypothetical protein